MSNRTLTWFMEEPPLGGSQRETYRMDGSYNAVRAWVNFGTAPTVEEIFFDIKVDGVSLFSYALRAQDETDAEEDNFSDAQISKDSLVSLEVTQRGGNPGSNVTVGLDLEAA